MKKRFLTTLFAASLFLGSVAPASNIVSANTEATITIQGTQGDATYKAYKLFDATIASPTADGQGVSYTLPLDTKSTYLANDGFKQLFDTVTNGDLVYVTRKQTATDVQIANWAKAFVEEANVAVTKQGREANLDGVETLAVPYGYYYVATTAKDGATVMVTSAAPNAIIQEKNNEPSWGDTGAKTVDSPTKSYNIGDTITYTLTYNNPTRYTDGQKVFQYAVKDVLGQGIALNPDSIEVFVNDQKLTVSNGGNSINTYRFVTKNPSSFELIIPWSATNTANAQAQLGNADDFYYPATSKIKVVYTATLKEEAAEGSVADPKNANKATINPNGKNTDTGKSVNVYNGQITIKKIDGQERTKLLPGAKFVLKNKTKAKFLKYASDVRKWVEVDTVNDATKYTTLDNGTVVITGLAAGTYELIEIEAPKGYNLKKAPTEVTLTVDTNLSDNNDSLMPEVTVENNQGAELPSTGGIGTTILYTLGASFVLGAGVVLVARRRLRD